MVQIAHVFSTIPIDLIALAAVAVLAVLDSMRGGTARAAALALAFPITYLLLQFVAGAQFLSGITQQLSSNLAQAIFSALILALVFILLYRVTESFESDVSIVRSIAAAIGLCIMLAIFWQLIPAFTTLWHPSTVIAHFFGETYRFWLMLAALAALAFAKN